MTIDEMINKLESLSSEKLEKANRLDNIVNNKSMLDMCDVDLIEATLCRKKANDYNQLAEWLKDYKRLLGAIDAIKAEIQVPTHDMWVQYSIKGHTDKDIQDTVSDVIKQSKKQVLAIIDRHISGGDADERNSD